MVRSLDNVYGTITRKEIITEDIEMHSKNDLHKVVEKGEVLDAVYLYEISPVSQRIDFSEQEVVDFENIIQILFIRYGEKCLDEKFLLDKLQREYMKYKVVEIFVNSVEKFYKAEFRRGRMGTIEMSSDSKLLHIQKANPTIINQG